MAFNDIKFWREMMDAEEQERLAYDIACQKAEERAAALNQQEFDDLDQVQVDPEIMGNLDSRCDCVCLDDLEDDEIDFETYGISEADLGVGPADEYTKLDDIMREPLVRIPAAMGRPASDADLAAQDFVKLMMETFKKFQESKNQEPLDEEMYEETDEESLTEDENTDTSDKIDQMSKDDDYPLSDEDWEEINSQDDYDKKIELIKNKVQEKWSSLSAEAKRKIQADISELRKDMLKNKWSDMKFKEALRLQKLSQKRELTDKELERFEHIIKYDLDDMQRHELEKNLTVNGYRISREGTKTRVPYSDAQSGNTKDHHTGDDADERSSETGLDSEFDPEQFPYIPEPMEPGTEIPADFDPHYPGSIELRNQLKHDAKKLAADLEPGHEQRKKAWARKEFADKLGDDFYTNDPKVWKKIVGALEPDEIEEIVSELSRELPGGKADNERMLNYMFNGMKIYQHNIIAQMGGGTDQKGKTGMLTQQGDKLINLLMYALAKHLNVATEHLDRFYKHMRSESTTDRDIRKEIRPILLNEICAELGVNLQNVGQELGVVPAYIGGKGNVKAKRAADQLIISLFIREYDHMTAAEREQLREIFQQFENKHQKRKMISGLNPDQNTEFQHLIIKHREEGDLSNEERIRLLQLYNMHKNPNVGEEIARMQAEREYANLTQNGDDQPFLNKTTQVAKEFLHARSGNVTKDTIQYVNRNNDENNPE